MNKEEARGYLMDITTKIGTIDAELLSDNDAFKMRDAINALYFDDNKDNTTTKIRIHYYINKGFSAQTICGNCNHIANGNFCSHCGKLFTECITKDLGKVQCKDCEFIMESDDNKTICMCTGSQKDNDNDGCWAFFPKEIK